MRIASMTYIFGVPNVNTVIVEDKKLHVAPARGKLDLPDPTAVGWDRPASETTNINTIEHANVVL